MKKLIFIMFCLLVTSNAHANIFNDAGSWVKSTYNKARSEAEKTANSVAKSAQYISKQAMKETVKLSKNAYTGMKDAANKMKDLIKNLGKIGKDCNALLSNMGNGFTNSLPKLPLGIPKIPPQLTNSQCKVYSANGFVCGIFPYLDGIAKSIAQGSANTKRLAQYVDRAYKSSACKHLNIIDRPACSLILGIANSAEESMSCAANVIADAAHGGKGNMSESDAEVICNKLGEFAFSVAADQLALGAAGDKDLKKVIQIAQLIRTALKTEHYVRNSEQTKNICKNGAKNKSGKKIYVAKKPLETVADILSPNPGKHLMLIKALDKNLCIDAYGGYSRGDRQVQSYQCHGKAYQRWSFHPSNRWDLKGKGYYYVKNDKYNTCMTSTPNGIYLKKCNQHLNEQIFKTYYKKESVKAKDKKTQYVWKNTGTMQNHHTGKCIGYDVPSDKIGHYNKVTYSGFDVNKRNKTNAENKKRHHNALRLKEYSCNDKKFNGELFVNDPAINLVQSKPGAHLNIYAFPSNPVCLDVHKKDKSVQIWQCGNYDPPTETWSFQHVTDKYPSNKNPKKTWNYGQIWNDAYGPRGCLETWGTGKGRWFRVADCHTHKREQQFRILPNGKIQSRASGMCLNIYGNRKANGTKVIQWPCEDAANEIWYKQPAK